MKRNLNGENNFFKKYGTKLSAGAIATMLVFAGGYAVDAFGYSGKAKAKKTPTVQVGNVKKAKKNANVKNYKMYDDDRYDLDDKYDDMYDDDRYDLDDRYDDMYDDDRYDLDDRYDDMYDDDRYDLDDKYDDMYDDDRYDLDDKYDDMYDDDRYDNDRDDD